MTDVSVLSCNTDIPSLRRLVSASVQTLAYHEFISLMPASSMTNHKTSDVRMNLLIAMKLDMDLPVVYMIKLHEIIVIVYILFFLILARLR